MTTNPYWPLFDLRVCTPRVELRYPDDADIEALARLAHDDFEVDGEPRWLGPWSWGTAGERARNVLQWAWRQRGVWTPESWSLDFVVVADGAVVGTQGMMAEQFAIRRMVVTGSWLALSARSRGIGAEMRAAILHLAFAALGAERAETSAWHDNVRSQGVTRKLGYRENGWARVARGDEGDWQLRFALDRAGWERLRRDDVTVAGLEGCRELFWGKNDDHG